MLARFRSWWKNTSKTLDAVIILSLVILLALVVLIILGYTYNWSWAGLRGKTLYDWLQLLIIPAVLAVGGYVFTYTTSRNDRAATEKRTQAERDIALDNQREAALQAYIDKISELLLKEHLGERTADGKLKPEYEQVCKIARVRTISVLTQLDARRVSYVFAFLREAGLMSTASNDNVVSLREADFREVNWSQAILSGANLSGVSLYNANLSGAILYNANLSGAILSEANLSDAIFFSKLYVPRAFGGTIILPNSANLSGADLSGANLSGAKFTDEQLAEARSLKGATMPDGTKHA